MRKFVSWNGDGRDVSDGGRQFRGQQNSNNKENMQRISDVDEDYKAMSEREPEDCIKVSKDSNLKVVAGKLAHTARTNDPPAILVIGMNALNVAIKAVAVARQYIEQDGLDLTLQPAFRRGIDDYQLALYLNKQPLQIKNQDDNQAYELKVVANCLIPKVAGALSARVREGCEVQLTGIGVEAVCKAMMVVARARVYLEKDNLDIRCQPQFVQVQKDTQTMTAVRLNIIAEQA